jgi:hypothetical protein
MINAIKTPHGALSDCITVHGVSVWTFFQGAMSDDLRRIENGTSTKYGESRPLRFSRRIIRSLRIIVSMLSSFLFIIRQFLNRPAALLLVSDQLTQHNSNNPRLTEVYAWLKKHCVSYGEVVHTTYGDIFFKNFVRRPIGIFYLDALRMIARVIVRLTPYDKVQCYINSADFTSFPSECRELIRKMVIRYYGFALESVIMIQILTVILHILHPKVFLTIDDIRHHNELLVAARATGVSSVVFQHSNFDHFFGSDSLPPEHYVFGDFFVVWSRYWAQHLPEMSSQFALHKDRIVIGGRANAATSPQDLIRTPHNQKLQKIFVPYEVNIPQTVACECMMLLRHCPEMHILFSLRKDMDTAEQLVRYGLTEKYPNVEVGSSFDLSQVDAAIGTYSTFLDDLVAMGIPVGVLHAGYRTLEDLSLFGLAAPLIFETMCKDLLELTQLSKEERSRRRSMLVDGWGNLDVVLSPFFTS